MAWLKRPVLLEDGKSWTLVKVREVPDSEYRLGWSQTMEEFHAFWGPWMRENASIIP